MSPDDEAGNNTEPHLLRNTVQTTSPTKQTGTLSQHLHLVSVHLLIFSFSLTAMLLLRNAAPTAVEQPQRSWGSGSGSSHLNPSASGLHGQRASTSPSSRCFPSPRSASSIGVLCSAGYMKRLSRNARTSNLVAHFRPRACAFSSSF
jgi:hypothetical protein